MSRQKVWLSPCPGVAVPAIMYRWWALYRDLDGRCKWLLYPCRGDEVCPR